MPADDYVPKADDPVNDTPVVFQPATFARHSRAVDAIEGGNNARYPRANRGRTTRPARGAWGLLHSGNTITAASALSLGSGSVTLCSRNGGALTDTGEIVPVYNAGGAISGPKTLHLQWTDGDWSVCECGGCAQPCLDCNGKGAPNKDLLFTWTGTGGAGSGSATMSADCQGHWTTPCLPINPPTVYELQTINSIRWAMNCGPSGVWEFAVSLYDNVGCATIFKVPTGGGIVTTNPFSLSTTWPLFGTSDFDALDQLGYQSVSVSDPSPDRTCCFMLFQVNSDCVDGPFQGATVSIWTDSSKATHIDSGTTDLNGYYDANLGTHAGSIYYEVSGLRYTTSSATLTVTCGEYNSVTPLTVNLVHDPAYVCVPGCISPIAKTLYATHPVFGPLTLVYNASGSHGAGWYDTVSYAYPGCRCCPPKTVAVTCFLSTSLFFQDFWKSN